MGGADFTFFFLSILAGWHFYLWGASGLVYLLDDYTFTLFYRKDSFIPIRFTILP